VWNACVNHEIKQCKTSSLYGSETKELAQRTQVAFCYSFNCIVPYYQLQFVIVHRVWHWQLTRHALDILKNVGLVIWLSVQTVKIDRNSNDKRYYLEKITPAHTHTPLSTPDIVYWILLGRRMATHVSFEVTVPSTLIITNWAAERSFTGVNILIHSGERPFSCSVCDYQCRRDCDLKRHVRRHNSPQ